MGRGGIQRARPYRNTDAKHLLLLLLLLLLLPRLNGGNEADGAKKTKESVGPA